MSTGGMMGNVGCPAIPIPVSLAACHAAWQPARTVSFVVNHPKTREIHAPDFADRVVHHLLVERLDKLYEPIFIHDSYANRMGKGSHAAVDRLQAFMRQRNGRGWFLQLDIHNYFNSIHRPTLYGLLKKRIAKAVKAPDSAAPHPGYAAERDSTAAGAFDAVRTAHPTEGLPPANALALRSLCHKLLVTPLQERVCDPAAAARIPPHKRLANAAPGFGLPVGNLTSQFFANVYLNELDQFIKHRLKCRLRRALFARYPWLHLLFELDVAARPCVPFFDGRAWKRSPAARIVLTPRWVLQGETYARQAEVFARDWPEAWRLLQRGNRWAVMPAASQHLPTAPQAAALQADLRRRAIPYVRAAQTGWLKHGTRRREIVEWFVPTACLTAFFHGHFLQTPHERNAP